MLETVNDLIPNKKNPAFEPVQMLALLQYVFTLNNASVRTRAAEVVPRHGGGDPKALEPFFTTALLLANCPVATAQEVNQ